MICRSYVCIALLISLVGCAPSKPQTFLAKGTIKTSQGEACAGALIVLHPTEKSRLNDPKPVATADESGNFVLRTYSMDDGAVPGEYGVTIVWPGKPSGAAEFSLSSEGAGVGPDRLGGRYGKPTEPVIKITIPSGGDQNITLQVDA
jgi:hypothetical protein